MLRFDQMLSMISSGSFVVNIVPGFNGYSMAERALLLQAIKDSPYPGAINLNDCQATDALRLELIDLLHNKSGEPLTLINANSDFHEVANVFEEQQKEISELAIKLAAAEKEVHELKQALAAQKSSSPKAANSSLLENSFFMIQKEDADRLDGICYDGDNDETASISDNEFESYFAARSNIP